MSPWFCHVWRNNKNYLISHQFYSIVCCNWQCGVISLLREVILSEDIGIHRYVFYVHKISMHSALPLYCSKPLSMPCYSVCAMMHVTFIKPSYDPQVVLLTQISSQWHVTPMHSIKWLRLHITYKLIILSLLKIIIKTMATTSYGFIW